MACRGAVVSYLGMLDELSPRDGLSHGVEGGEVVVHTVLLSIATTAGGVAAPESKLKNSSGSGSDGGVRGISRTAW